MSNIISISQDKLGNNRSINLDRLIMTVDQRNKYIYLGVPVRTEGETEVEWKHLYARPDFPFRRDSQGNMIYKYKTKGAVFKWAGDGYELVEGSIVTDDQGEFVNTENYNSLINEYEYMYSLIENSTSYNSILLPAILGSLDSMGRFDIKGGK